MKYVINRRIKKNERGAGCSARDDAFKIMTGEGWKPLYVGCDDGSYNKIIRNIILLTDILRLRFATRRDDIVCMQWPFTQPMSGLFYRMAYKGFRNIWLLVHDIDLLRGNKDPNHWYERFFTKAERVIVHSEQMKRYVTERWIDVSKVRVLTAFDYLTDDVVTNPRRRTKDVVFAGNLLKSPFLAKISENELGLTVNCYGYNPGVLGRGLRYKGSFASDKVSVLEGSWGLVWDGDAIDACTGSFGEYQKYNAPHKLSLYIVAHLPVIVWDQAAMASYVKERGIGICVSSLKDISKRIDSMTDEEYNRILENVRRESDLLRKGEHLRKCLE